MIRCQGSHGPLATILVALDSSPQDLSRDVCFAGVQAVPHFLELFCRQSTDNLLDDALKQADGKVPMTRFLWSVGDVFGCAG